jgi:hypothetical protein
MTVYRFLLTDSSNVDAPDANFGKSYLFSDAQSKKFGNLKCYDCKEQKKTLIHEMEPNSSKDRAMHEGDDPSFRHLNFFLIVKFISVF